VCVPVLLTEERVVVVVVMELAAWARSLQLLSSARKLNSPARFVIFTSSSTTQPPHQVPNDQYINAPTEDTEIPQRRRFGRRRVRVAVAKISEWGCMIDDSQKPQLQHNV
jgi:hypothetical protein